MAVSRKVERELLRENYLNVLIDSLLDKGETVLRVKSNEIAIPVVGCESNEDYIVVTVKVPTGANKGTEPYDGYEMAQDYEMKIAEKKEKAERKEKEKAKKIAKDKEIREKKNSISKEEIEQYEKEMKHAPSYLATVGKENT
ncbi:MAG: hypothetical protein SPL06_06460 [Bacteroidales bacterium]|nr:hypothetical protein [Bacteroidales bacterium]